MIFKDRPLATVRQFAAWASLAGGLAVLIGWYLQIPVLVQINPTMTPMQANTALCFVLLSVALIVQNRQMTLGLAMIIECISLATLGEHLFNQNLGIDTLLVKPFLSFEHSVPGRMAFNSTIAFILSGYALVRIDYPKSNPSPGLVCLLSLLTGCIGLVSIFGYLFSLDIDYGWSSYLRVAPTSAVGFVLLATGLLASTVISAGGAVRAKIWWMMILSFITGIIISTMLWSWASKDQSLRVKEEVADKSISFLTLIQSKLHSDIEFLQSTEGFFAGSEDVTREEFNHFTMPLLKDHPSITAIDWSPRVTAQQRQAFEKTIASLQLPGIYGLQQHGSGEQSFVTRSADEIYYPVLYSEPSVKNRRALGFDHYSDPVRRTIMEEALKSGQPTSTSMLRLFRLEQNTTTPSDFLVMIPSLTLDHKAVRGFVVGIFRAFDFFQEISRSATTIPLDYTIRESNTSEPFLQYKDGELLKSVQSAELRNQSSRAVSFAETIDVAGKKWTIELSPSTAYFEQLHNWLPTLVLVIGLAITTFISFYVFFLRAQNERVQLLVKQTNQTNQKLAKEIAERIAIEDVLRLEAERQKELVSVQRELSFLNRSTDEAMGLIMERTQKTTGADGTLIEVLDGDFLEYRAVYGKATPYLGFRVHRDASMSGLAIKQNAVLECKDSEIDPRVNREACQKIGARSMIVVPLHQDGKPMGVLKVFSSRANAFTTQSIITLQLLAGVMSSAIRNADIMGALQRSEQQFKNAFTHAAVGVALIDLKGKWFQANRSLCLMLGYTESELLGKSFEEFTHPDDLAQDEALMKDLTDNNSQSYRLEMRYFHKNTYVVWVLRSVSIVRDEKGAPLHFIAQIQDINEQKFAERAIKEKNTLLARATEFKSQFLANMSHEIRTPLTSIIGYSESLLADKVSNEERILALETVLRNSKHLLGIINDILDLSKIEAGKLDIEEIPVSLFDLISDVDNLMRHKAMEQGITFTFEYQYPLPKTIQTDPLRLKQILINLIGNAIKFTARGSVTVRVTHELFKERVSFAVIDTGVGLSTEQQHKLFKAFSQADTSTTREFGGTGLGLVISEQLAMRLGGGINVESTLGEGSTFTAYISTGSLQSELINADNLPRPKAIVYKKQKALSLSGTILLAEDGLDNQQYISYLLNKAEVEFILVENGALAIEACKARVFDLILMDMQMPVMDGYTATKTLRDIGCTIPIVALTANGMPHDVERSMRAGCTDFLGKPFERQAFFEKLGTYLHPKEEKADSSSADAITTIIEDPDFLPLIRDFIDRLPNRLSEIDAAVSGKQWDTVSMLTHRLRGAHMFGFPQLGEDAGVIEDLLRKNSDEDLSAPIEKLKTTCKKIEIGKKLTFH